MPIVTFWSRRTRETAQTLSMIAIATHMAVEHNHKILIVDTYFDNPTISKCFWDDKLVGQNLAIKKLSQGKLDLGTGTSGLTQLVGSGKGSPELIKDYTKVIFKDRLEVLTNNTASSPSELGRQEASFKEIIQTASKYYDYVFVDLQKGFERPFISDILGISDLIVMNLTQRIVDLDEFKELREKNKLFNAYKVLPIIGRYDKFSKYTKKNIARYLGDKGEIPAVSYNTLFFEHANEGMVSAYFMKFRKSIIESTDRNANFINEIALTTDEIFTRIQAIQMGF